jgi:hypothetical protein
VYKDFKVDKVFKDLLVYKVLKDRQAPPVFKV